MTSAVVQARMTSTRLPGKVLMDVAGKPVLKAIVDRLRGARTIERIVIATTTNRDDDPIAELCRQEKVPVFRGDEADVLGRYRDVSRAFDCDPIVRVTADCPMLDPAIVDAAVTLYRADRFDYVSNVVQRTFPDGLDIEVFSRAALEEAAERAQHPLLREHVTPYIRGIRPDLGAGAFRLGHLLFAANFSHVRWTLDRTDDLERIRTLLRRLPENYTWLQALAESTRQPALLGLPS